MRARAGTHQGCAAWGKTPPPLPEELFPCHKPCPDFPAGPSISEQGAVPLRLPGAWCQQGESGTSAAAPSKALTSTKQRGHEAGILLGIPAGTAPGAVLWGPSSDGGGGRTDLCTQLCTADAPCPPRRAMPGGRGGPSWHWVPQDTLPRPGEPPGPFAPTCPCHSATFTSTMLSGRCSSETRIWFS